MRRAERVTYGLASAVVASTVLLLVAGAIVTSLDVGMADTEWPTPPWYLAVSVTSGNARERGIGFLLEHAHRQLGWLVGFLVVGLVLWGWLVDRRRWVRCWSFLLLLAVGIQGILGGLRVLSVYREVAVLHGLLAQLFLAACWSFAALARRHPDQTGRVSVGSAGRWLGTGLVLLWAQSLSGLVLRHLGTGLWFHVTVAPFAVLATTGIGLLVWTAGGPRAYSGRAGLLLAGGATQALLGALSWVTSNGFGPYAWEPVSGLHVAAATAHALLASLLLGAISTIWVEERASPLRAAAQDSPEGSPAVAASLVLKAS
jgi:heme A synthase